MQKINGIYCEAFGAADRPCIILILGLGAQLIHWPIPVIQGLVDNGFYVVIFDNRDVGLSRYYDDLGVPNIAETIEAKRQGKAVYLPYTLEDMADDVISLMDGLRIEKAHIAGVSMGGMISQILASVYPERVLSLTCVASTSGAHHLPPSTPEVMGLYFVEKKELEALDAYIDGRIQMHKVSTHPEDQDENGTRLLGIRAYQRAHHPDGFKRQLLAIMAAAARDPYLKKLAVKSLVIHGDYDPVFPLAHGRHLAQCIPNSRLEIIEKMGHGVPERVHSRIVTLMTDVLLN